ncbi:unnamed protein product [Eruca vesicaria subsp. sativa]|uniref:Methyltransferase n=1 Tax=Eruca vesicaria subsp. sativa TaxID=29727 RepID=A0ABC8JDW8_ERUVS|nr:unnamed protein product [Eruca vesicaria subsp. sativa]
MDRILRPEGKVLIRDSPEVLDKVARMAHAVRWSSSIHDKEPESHGRERILVARQISLENAIKLTLKHVLEKGKKKEEEEDLPSLVGNSHFPSSPHLSALKTPS